MSSPNPEHYASSSSGSPPPPSPTAELVVRRRRANTFTNPPQPETNPVKYTKERIQEGLEYANARLQSTSRKPSPTTQKALAEYVLACKDFLEGESTQKLIAIFQMEQDLCEKTILHALKEDTDHKLTSSLQELRRYQFLAQYGNYLENTCTKLKIAAGKYRTPQWEELAGGKKWTEISTKLKNEELEWKKNGSRNEHLVQTTIAVRAACLYIGIDFDHALKSIHLYAERNEKFHNTFNLNIERGKFASVADTLYNDLMEVERVCYLEDAKDQVLLEVLINQLIDNWFDRSFLREEPSSWVPKQTLRDQADRKDPEQRQKRAAENRERAEANTAKKIQKMAEEDEILAALMGLEPEQLMPKELAPLAQGKGRKRQSKEIKELFTPRTKRKRWEEIVKIGRNVQKAKGLARMHETAVKGAEGAVKDAKKEQKRQQRKLGALGREWILVSNEYRQGTGGSEPPTPEKGKEERVA